MPSAGTIALIDAMLMMTPPFAAATIATDSARVARKTPFKQTLTTAFHWSTAWACTGEYQPMPAAFSPMSSRPKEFVAWRSTGRPIPRR